MTILANEYKDIFSNLASMIPEYGRYDDLAYLIDTESKQAVIDVVKTQLKADIDSEKPSLLGKWLPSENTSSKDTRDLAKKVRMGLGMKESTYRKVLSGLRKAIKLVEHNLTNKEYQSIEYGKLPSQAGFKYRKAFKKHDEKRYEKYLENVAEGKEKMNTKTLYTYQIYKAVQNGDSVKALDVMWNALPDYTQGKNALVVADVSGSMSGDPMSVSVSLALYFADKNKGQFKDHFITFSGNPKLQKVNGKNIKEKMYSIENAEWEMNTDLYKVFKVLVDTAVTNNTPSNEMPETIYIISDMEFDSATQGQTNYEAIKALFDGTDYKIPNVVFWNVSARNKQVPVTKNTHGVTLVSGFSPSTFKLVVENKSPLELMNDVINSDRYCKILA